MSLFKKFVGGGDKDKPKADPAKSKTPAIPAGEQATRRPGGPPSGAPAREQAGHTAPSRAENRDKNALFSQPDEAAAKLRATESFQDFQPAHAGEMLELLSRQAGLEFIKLGDIPKHQFTPELLATIPSEVARQYKIFPVNLRADGTVVVAISDPLNVRIVDDLRLFLVNDRIRDVEAVVASEDDIVDYINLMYGLGDETLEKMVEAFDAENEGDDVLKINEGALDLSDLEKISQDEPIIKFCNLLLLQAIKDRASDLHIEPFSNVIRIRYRVDGALREIPSPPKSWQIGIVSRFKVMASLDIAENRRPQDGRIKLTIEGREVDLRLSTLPVVYGECIVMRLLDKTMMMIGVQQIGMTEDVLERFMKIVQRPNGILLVTGPTGSGKTTTLYAAINEINNPTEKIITTEDPVEYQVDGIVQININANVGLTFARCLRAILRQDPDVILVGEIRDLETAQIAIQASLTGHLVFSTLHTNSAAATISRLVDMGIEPFLITSTLEGIIAQRLIRCICPRCRRPYRPTAEELADFGATHMDVQDIEFFKGGGCDECAHTGYKGRLGIFELLVVSDEVRDLILSRATTDEIHETAIRQGMKTMRQDGWLKICLGVTTFDEVTKHTPKESAEVIKQEMEGLLRATTGVDRSVAALPMTDLDPIGGDPTNPEPAARPD